MKIAQKIVDGFTLKRAKIILKIQPSSFRMTNYLLYTMCEYSDQFHIVKNVTLFI